MSCSLICPYCGHDKATRTPATDVEEYICDRDGCRQLFSREDVDLGLDESRERARRRFIEASIEAHAE